MAPVHRLFSETAFDPELTHAMGVAFDKACQSLHDTDQPEVVKELLAKRIVELARRGERNPDRLCEEALKGVPQ